MDIFNLSSKFFSVSAQCLARLLFGSVFLSDRNKNRDVILTDLIVGSAVVLQVISGIITLIFASCDEVVVLVVLLQHLECCRGAINICVVCVLCVM
jgi:hypothetical protein